MPPPKKSLSIANGKFVIDSDGNIQTVGGNSAASNIGKVLGIGSGGETTFVTAGGGGTPSNTVSYGTTPGQTPSAGTATSYARGDHSHGTPPNPVPGHESSYDHTLLHAQKHSISSSSDHSSSITTGYILKADANGLPAQATNTDSDVASAVSLKHSNSNDPTADQKAALAGTSGTPSASNKYVTNADSRMTDSRTPTAHGSSAHSGTIGTWAQIDKSTSSIGDITTRSHTALTDIGSNTHAQIDSFISSKAAANGIASLDSGSKVVQDPANATSTPTASKIPIANGSGKLDSWVTTFAGSAVGLVPSSAGGTTNYLRADGSWAAPTGGGGYPGQAVLTSPVSISNSSSETDLITLTIAGGTMSAGTTYLIRAYGVIGTTSSAPTATWRVRIGSGTTGDTLITSIAPTVATSLSNKPWCIEFMVTVRTSGASGTIIGNGVINGEYSTTLAQAVKGTATTATVSVDTTISRVLHMSFQFGTANASNTLAVHNATIDRIY